MNTTLRYSTGIAVALLMAATLMAQPTLLWQTSGIPKEATAVAVAPGSGVVAVAAKSDAAPAVKFRHPNGRVVTYPLTVTEPTLRFLDDSLLLVYSTERSQLIEVDVDELTASTRWSAAWDPYKEFNVEHSEMDVSVSMDGRYALLNTVRVFLSKPNRCAVMDLSTMTVLEVDTMTDVSQRSIFRHPGHDRISYDRDEIILNDAQRITIPDAYVIFSVFAYQDTCWVLHRDTANTSVWLTRVSLNPLAVIRQQNIYLDPLITPVFHRECRPDRLIVHTKDHERVLNSTTFETIGKIDSLKSSTPTSYTSEGGVYISPTYELISVNTTLTAVDTLERPAVSVPSFAQDRRGKLYAAHARVRELHPTTGVLQKADDGYFAQRPDYFPSHISADTTSDRFSVMAGAELLLFENVELDSVTCSVGSVKELDGVEYDEDWMPLQCVSFKHNSPDIIVAGRITGISPAITIHRISPGPNSVPISRMLVRLNERSPGPVVANSNAIVFALPVPDTTYDVRIVGARSAHIDNASSVIYDPDTQSFLADHRDGVQAWNERDTTPTNIWNLGGRVHPLAIQPDRPSKSFVWAFDEALMLFDERTGDFDPTFKKVCARPLTMHVDHNGAWFVVSYPLGVMEGYSLGPTSNVDEGEPSTTSAPALTLHPNPASNNVTITADAPINSWSLYSVSGQHLLSGTDPSIITSTLSPGAYYVVVNIGNQRLCTMVSVVR